MNFAEFLKTVIGLDVTTVGEPAVEHAVRRRMTACGIDHRAEYWELVQTSAPELQELIEAVVVPETWFFRHREAFEALAKFAMERVAAGEDKPLRLLSAPCSTGEEPYSMAITLREAGLQPAHFVIDAVDISIRVLERAETAVYGSNSFRNQDLAFRDRHFSKEPGGYQFSDDLRRTVRFRQRNLLAGDFTAGMDRYDFIFCRNVLIYFDQPTQKKLLESLRTLLLEGGLLFVGPAEATLATASGFAAVRYPSAFAFRKRTGAEPPPAKPLQPAPKRSLLAARPIASTKPARVEKKPKDAEVSPLRAAELLADAGRFREAAEICEARLKQQNNCAHAYYLLGLLADAQRQSGQAMAHYRKAVYLDPQHSEALVHLALLLEQKGDRDGAQRLRYRAERSERVQMRAGERTARD